jgi:flavodoxin
MTATSVLTPGSKVLIAWFTRSGLTKKVVDVLQPLVHADLYEIKTGVTYGGIFGALKGAYHSLKALQGQTLETPVPDVALYDVFIIACPVWNYRQPPPVSAFLAAVNFSGKPVISLGTCQSNMKGFNEALEKEVVNGRFIAKDGFYDVGHKTPEALTDVVNQWLVGL